MSVHDSAWTGKPGHWAHREPRDSNIREAMAYSLIKGDIGVSGKHKEVQLEPVGVSQMKPSHTS